MRPLDFGRALSALTKLNLRNGKAARRKRSRLQGLAAPRASRSVSITNYFLKGPRMLSGCMKQAQTAGSSLPATIEFDTTSFMLAETRKVRIAAPCVKNTLKSHNFPPFTAVIRIKTRGSD